jgi:hypothetical protein
VTKSQTRTISWRTRKASEDSDAFTVSTVYTDKQPGRQGRQTGRLQRKEPNL